MTGPAASQRRGLPATSLRWGAPLLILMAALGPAAPAAANGGSSPDGAIVTIRTGDGEFRARVTDPESIRRAREELAQGRDAGVPIGPLAWGSGGVNRGHRWHLTDLTFADVTTEVCDGTVRMVDNDPRYWVETVRYFCPWNSEVVGLLPVGTRRP